MKVYLYVLGDIVKGLNLETNKECFQISLKSYSKLENNAIELAKQIDPKKTLLLTPLSPITQPIVLGLNNFIKISPANFMIDYLLKEPDREYLKYPNEEQNKINTNFSTHNNLEMIIDDIKNKYTNFESIIMCISPSQLNEICNDENFCKFFKGVNKNTEALNFCKTNIIEKINYLEK